MTELRILGGVDLLGPEPERLQPLLTQPKIQALLCYLAIARPRGIHRRDTLLGLLWPELDQARGRGALRKAIYAVRQALGSEAILSRGEVEVWLNDEVIGCDVVAFEEAVEADELQRAVQLYRGELLAGFFLTDGAEFEHWMERERQRLARAYRTVLERLGERAVKQGEHLAAVSWWRQVTEQDPYSTRVALRVMEALEGAGDRAGALQLAEQHAARLREDLDAEPAPDVVAYAERLRGRPEPLAALATQAESSAVAERLERFKAAIASRYTILGELGAGGMATVFLATDRKHQRKVAVKVLRPELAAVLGAERFLNEIKVTANLQHPHILPLHDSGEADSFLYYVMPFVEGESLRDRLNREKQLPVDDAVRIVTAVASALEYAHRRDVIHRDIKPENILLHDGQPLVADFGIALAVSSAGGTRLTETGLSLGTPQYMSPELAAGDRNLDARTDIYALAVVTYEMLAGEPPFTGPTAQAIIARVITDRPRPLEDVRDTVPVNVAVAVERGLAKLPADRFASVSSFAEALQAEAVTDPMWRILVRGTPRRTRRWMAALLLWAAVSTAAALWLWLQRPSVAVTASRWIVSLPPELGYAGSLALSPDGTRLVYAAGDSAGVRLYLREMNRVDAVPIPGTTGAGGAFFSPDGEWIGFTAGNELHKVAVGGGRPTLLATLSSFSAGAGGWGTNDMIVVSDMTRGLILVPASGGTPQVLPSPPGQRDIVAWPQLVRGGALVLASLHPSRRLASLEIESGEWRVVRELNDVGLARYLPSGHLLYEQGGALRLVPFDAVNLLPRGPSVSIIDGVSHYATSDRGSLAYVSGLASEKFMLLWVDREGRSTPFTEDRGAFQSPQLSPDGRRLAVAIQTSDGNELWLYDSDRGGRRRLSSDSVNMVFDPVWHPDGRSLAVAALEGPSANLVKIGIQGERRFEYLLDRELTQDPYSWSSDGAWLAYYELHPERERDIWLLSQTGETRPLLTTEHNERSPAISPDGRWLAYVSDESGRDEVYLARFPGLERTRLVSRGGGHAPTWSAGTGELFFLSGNHMMSVEIDSEGNTNGPIELFAGPYVTEAGPGGSKFYAVAPDGRQFVMITRDTGDAQSGEQYDGLGWASPEAGVREIQVLLNWDAALTTRGRNPVRR